MQPIGLSLHQGIISKREGDALVKMVSKIPAEKRSPWSTEGFGGQFQKTYFITDQQVIKKVYLKLTI